jgi:trans-aconitate methyltransferase
MTTEIWNAEHYATHGRFVADQGVPLLEMLDARPDECILDLGCGNGVLTKKIVDLGCKVIGLDSSPQLVSSARMLGLQVVESDACDMSFSAEFDAVFSHAALHWMKDADRVLGRIAKALRPKGRFVAEMSGHNSIKPLHEAFVEELNRRGYDGQAASPWYFPTAEDYATRLGDAGFEIEYIALSSCMTSLPGDVMMWVTALGGCFTNALPQPEREDYIQSVRARIESHSRRADGELPAGVFALRFKARLTT